MQPKIIKTPSAGRQKDFNSPQTERLLQPADRILAVRRQKDS